MKNKFLAASLREGVKKIDFIGDEPRKVSFIQLKKNIFNSTHKYTSYRLINLITTLYNNLKLT